MFLSTENPPHDHPLPSSSFLHLTTLSHELAQSHLQNFSIRDYANSNRKNNIKNNWPFSSKSLQLLSTHGVTDPLPPFQKLSTVSNQFKTTSKQIVSHVQQGKDLAKLGLNQTIVKTKQGGCSQSRIVENGLFTSTSVSKSKEEIVLVAATSNNSKSKKCGRGGMVKSKEATCAGLESIMASKTCPICKTFSSASNTTLNAHIDQCISVDSAVITKADKPRVNQCMYVDSAMPLVSSSKPNKPRGKPRMKVKTMVDIYASAKRCTLEDLDKRNGTKWAVISSYPNRVVADKSEVSKKRKVPHVGVGPVYVDAKGQKLRIITEFSEKKTSTTATTSLREQQHEDGGNEKKSSCQGSKENGKSSRKRGRGKKHHKYIKLNSNKANASEKIPEYQRGASGEGSKRVPRRIYNERMLAKRGSSSKKLNEKGHQSSEDDDDDDDDSWSGGDHAVLRGTALSALNKQKLRSKLSGRNKTMFANKRVGMSEKEETSLAGAHLNTFKLKRSLTSIQEDKYQRRKNVREVREASPRASSMRKLLPPFVANGWRRLSLPVELKRARFDLSEEDEDEEETGKWESEMTQADDDYVSGDNGERNEVLGRPNPLTFSGYNDYEDDDDDDDDEESSEEEEDDNEGDKADETGAEFYQSNETIPSERAYLYNSEEVENMVYEEEEVRFDSEVGKGSLYVEVDTIPIPGPPGSFIPSPRGMSFGNSSVITSQLHSSMDQQLDRNSSESPVSAFSNFAAGRLSFPAELFSVDVPSSYTTTPLSFPVPSHQGTVAEAEQMSVDKTTTPSSFRNNGQESCCCQRKERISEGVTLNHQESHLLQRRAAASSSMVMNLAKSHTRLDQNHPYMIQQEFDLHNKFSDKANVNVAVVPPSPSNSVLRLMGKDLMVMNQGEADSNDEEASLATLKPTPQTQFLDPTPCAGTGLYLNTGLYLRNSLEPTTHQPQTQASAFRNNFDHVSYFSPS